ncbi:MAG: B12-binding domain-containing radical SAM protein [Firmicutes bacterium]|nr:B12-binding domain-containing radical SAM protein [Bacillota bacterium]
MKVALIQPARDYYIGFQHVAMTEPLGIEAVAGALGAHDLYLLDMRIDKNLEKFLLRCKPDAVGVAVPFTNAVYAGQEVLKTVRRVLPKAYTFVGGHHAALNPTDFFGRCDVIVAGEGEQVTAELLSCVEDGKDFSDIPGLMFIKDGEPYSTGERPLIDKLDNLPLVNRSIAASYAEKYFFRDMAPVTMIETARGCPYRCTFCSVWKFNRGRYRQKSPERVLEEIKQAPTDNVLFSDDNFMSNVTRAKKIAKLIKDSGIKKRYGCQARTDTIAKHPELIRQLREAGLSWVLIGFESFDEEHLAKLNKKNNVESNMEAVKVLHDNDIDIWAAFIVDPEFGRKEFRQLQKYIKRLKVSSCQITVLTPLPGTDLFREKLHQLTSRNYELFDFFHAVLPTKLPLKEFYREFCKLYRRVAITPNILEAFKSPSNFSIRNIMQGIQIYNNLLRAKSYLKGHLQAEPKY